MKARYKLRDKIGEDELGIVYKALDEESDRMVALKRFYPLTEADEEKDILAGEDALIADALIFTGMESDRVVKVLEIDQDEKGAYMVMEMAEGTTLAETLLERPWNLEEFKAVASQLLEALVAFEAKKRIHGDLRPKNILLRQTSEGILACKVVNFGMPPYRQLPHFLTVETEIAADSEVFFMAPEQFEDEPVDNRADLYSAGCIFYYGLTGQPPFQGLRAAHVMESHMTHHVTPLYQVNPEVPAPVAAWIMKLIEREADMRPINAQAALDKLQSLSAFQSIPELKLEAKPLAMRPPEVLGTSPEAGVHRKSQTAPVAGRIPPIAAHSEPKTQVMDAVPPAVEKSLPPIAGKSIPPIAGTANTAAKASLVPPIQQHPHVTSVPQIASPIQQLESPAPKPKSMAFWLTIILLPVLIIVGTLLFFVSQQKSANDADRSHADPHSGN